MKNNDRCRYLKRSNDQRRESLLRQNHDKALQILYILPKGLKVSFSFAQNPSSLLFPSSARRLMVAKNASFEVTKHKRPHSHSFFKSANLALHCTEVPKSLNPPKYFILSVISRIFQANFERFAFKTCFNCCRPVNFRNF